MSSIKRISVFTGTRAEYGLLRKLLAKIESESVLQLELIISGCHFSSHYGRTVAEIESDGFIPFAVVPLNLDAEANISMSSLTAEVLSKVGDIFSRSKPDLLIILGDRYETFGAAAAAHLQSIPILHLHGGESTEGALDDRLRHAITQLSTWHFTAAESYRQRVISMGFPPENVFNVGPMVLDSLYDIKSLSRTEFASVTGYCFAEKNLLVTYHPETLLHDQGTNGFEIFLNALEQISCNILFTHPNADHGREQLLVMLNDFVSRHSSRCYVTMSLGHSLYLNALCLFEGVAGNSSSGLIEAPLFNTPVLNIGQRQAGRIRSNCVIDSSFDFMSIKRGLQTILDIGTRTYWPRALPSSFSPPSEQIVSHILNS